MFILSKMERNQIMFLLYRLKNFYSLRVRFPVLHNAELDFSTPKNNPLVISLLYYAKQRESGSCCYVLWSKISSQQVNCYFHWLHLSNKSLSIIYSLAIGFFFA